MDPFRAVQEEVHGSLVDLKADFAKWQKLPSKSPKKEQERQRLLSSLSELQVDLQDMQATIDIALNEPTKFALTPSELMSRQDFVRDLQAQANDLRDVLETPSKAGLSAAVASSTASHHMDRKTLLANQGTSSDYRGGIMGERDGGGAEAPAAGRQGGAAWRDNEAACIGAQQQQMDSMAQQELELGNIGKSVDRLGEMSRVINSELRSQGQELDAFSSEVDDVSGKMTTATAVMKKMLKNKDRGKLCAILVLTIVLILLMYAVIAW